jgi:hypothetical protein
MCIPDIRKIKGTVGENKNVPEVERKDEKNGTH